MKLKKLIATILIISMMLDGFSASIANGLNFDNLTESIVDTKKTSNYEDLNLEEKEGEVVEVENDIAPSSFIEEKDIKENNRQEEDNKHEQEASKEELEEDKEEPEVDEEKTEETENKKEENITSSQDSSNENEEQQPTSIIKEELNNVNDEKESEKENVQNENQQESNKEKIEEKDISKIDENNGDEQNKNNEKEDKATVSETDFVEEKENQNNELEQQISTKSDTKKEQEKQSNLGLILDEENKKSTESNLYGSSTNLTVDYVEFNKNGEMKFYLSYPPGDDSYRFDSSTYVFVELGKVFPFEGALNDYNESYFVRELSDKTFNRSDIVYEVNDHATGKVVFKYDARNLFSWDNFYKEFKGCVLNFQAIRIYDYSRNFNRSGLYTTIGGDIVHKWKEDWKDSWVCVYDPDNMDDQDVIDYRINEIKSQNNRIEIIDANSAKTMLNTKDWDSGVQKPRYYPFFNTSLGISAVVGRQVVNSGGESAKTIYLIYRNGEKFGIDGDNAKNLFKNTGVYFVDWEKMYDVTGGLLEGATTMESWYEGLNFENTISGSDENEKARLDLFKYVDVSNVTSMKNMFKNTKEPVTGEDGGQELKGSNYSDVLDLFNTVNLTDISGMFEGAQFNCGPKNNITDKIYCQIIKHLNTTNVTTMENMFKDTTGYQLPHAVNNGYGGKACLDISNFETPNLVNIGGMFNNGGIATVFFDEAKWDISHVTNDTDIFTNTTIVGENGSTINDWYIQNNKTYARRDTYNVPGLFTQRGDNLYRISFTTDLVNADGGIATEYRGEFPIVGPSRVYKSTVFDHDTAYHHSRKDQYQLRGFKIGDSVSFFNGEYDILEYPKIGDLAYENDDPTILSPVITRDGPKQHVYVCTEYRKSDGTVLNFDETTKTFSPFTVTGSQLNSGSETNATEDQIHIIFRETTNTATFKSAELLSADITTRHPAGFKVTKPRNFKENEAYKGVDGNIYKFLYWEKEGTTGAYDFNTYETTDVTFIARVQLTNEYVNVQFVDNENLINIPDAIVKKNATVSEPTTPVAGDEYSNTSNTFEFEYWYKIEGTPFDFSTPITVETTLYAKWIKKSKQYTVQFVSDYFGPFPDQKVVENQKAVDNMGYVKNTYYEDGQNSSGDTIYRKFLGWNDKQDGSGVDIADKIITEPTIFYARWEYYDGQIAILHFDSRASGFTVADRYFPVNESGFDVNSITELIVGQVYKIENDYRKLTNWISSYNSYSLNEYFTFEESNTHWRDFPHFYFEAEWDDDVYVLVYESDHGVLSETMRVVDYGYTLLVSDDDQNVYEYNRSYYQPRSPRVGNIVEENGHFYKLISWTGIDTSSNFSIWDYVTTLTANWQEVIAHKVSFINTKGINIETQVIEDGERAVMPSVLPMNYEINENGVITKFFGWEDTSTGADFDFNTQITTDVELRAKWRTIDAWKISYGSGTSGFATTSIVVNGQNTQLINVEKNIPTTEYLPSVPAIGTEITENGKTKKLKYWKYYDKNNILHTFTDATNAITFDQNTLIVGEWETKKIAKFKGVNLSNPDLTVGEQGWYTSEHPTGKIISTPSDYAENVYIYKDTVQNKSYLLKYWYVTDSTVPYDFSVPVTDDIVFTAFFVQVPNRYKVTLKTKYYSYYNYRYENLLDGQSSKVYEVEENKKFIFPYPIFSAWKRINENYYYYIDRYIKEESGSQTYLDRNITEWEITKDITFYLDFASLGYVERTVVGTYKSNYGIQLQEIRYNRNYSIYPPASPRVGDIETSNGMSYQMLGWYEEGDASQTLISFSGLNKNSDFTFVAKWMPKIDVNVTFVDSYKAPPVATVVEAGEKIPRPTTHTTGEADFIVGGRSYTFVDWYEVGSDTPFDFNAAIDDSKTSITIEARYRTLQTINFDIVHSGVSYSGGTLTNPAVQNVYTGERVTEPTIVSDSTEITIGSDIYVFRYWWATSSNVPYDFNLPVKGDMLLTAKWLKKGNLKTYKFVGINRSNPEEELTSGTWYDGLYPDGYIISSNVKDSSNVDIVKDVYKQQDMTVRKIYTFKYWYSTDSNVEFDFSVPQYNDIVLRAKWEESPIKWKVKLEVSYNEYDPSDSNTYQEILDGQKEKVFEIEDGQKFKLPYPPGTMCRKVGQSYYYYYVFYYSRKNRNDWDYLWWQNSTTYTTNELVINQDETIRINISYYSSSSGERQTSASFIWGPDYTNPAIPTETFTLYEYMSYFPPATYTENEIYVDTVSGKNYMFRGWKEEETSTTILNDWPRTHSYPPAKMYYGEWMELTEKTVTFVDNYKTPPTPITIMAGNKITKPTTHTDGEADIVVGGDTYKFIDWYETGSNAPFDFTNTVILDDITIEARYKKLNTVNFDIVHPGATYTGGTLANPTPQNVWDEDLVTKPNIINESDEITVGSDTFIFKYWWATSSTVPYDFNLPVKGDMLLTAKWQNKGNLKTYKFVGLNINNPEEELTSGSWYEGLYPDGYIISSNVKDASNVDIIKDVYTIKDTIEKKLYTFKYWYSTDSNVEFDFSIPQYDDVVLRAKWIEGPLKWKVTLQIYNRYSTSTLNLNRFENIIDGQAEKIYEVDDGETFTFEYPVGFCYKAIDNTQWYRLTKYERKNGTNWEPLWNIGDYQREMQIIVTQNETIRLYFDDRYSSSQMKTRTFIWGPVYSSPEIPTEVFRSMESDYYYPPTTYLIGDKFISPTTGIKYKFLGWKLNDTTTQIKPNSYWPVSGGPYNLEYYAAWTEVTEKTVTFVDNYKTPPSAIDVTTGDKVSRPTTHTTGEADIVVGNKTYRFIDWYQMGSNTPFDFANTTITTDITIEAKYQDVSRYNVSFNINMAGEESKQPAALINVLTGNYITEPTTIQKGYLRKEYVSGVLNRAYRFDYWYSTNSNIEYDFVNVPITSSFTMTARWTELQVYDVTFDAVYTNATITNPATQKVLSGATASEPENFNTNTLWERKNAAGVTVEAHRFKYWYETDDTIPFNFKNNLILATTNLRATWSTIPIHKVTFKDTSGYFASSQLKTYILPPVIEGIADGDTISTPSVINVNEVVKVGAGQYYKFAGWTNNGTDVFDFNQGIHGNLELDTKWTTFTGATVTFNLGPKFPSYTNPASQVVYPDVHITEPTEIRQGNTDIIYESDNHNHKYEFQYWYVEGGDPNTPFDFAIDPTSDVILVPKYTDTQVNVIKFNTGGIISTPSDQNVPSGGTIAQPRDPSNPSSSAPYPAPGSEHPHGGHVYKFDYWYSTDSNIPYDFTKPVDNHETLTIKWTDVTPWSVTFVTAYGNAPTGQTITNGNKAVRPSSHTTNTVEVILDPTTGERTEAFRFVKWFEQGDTTETAFDFENTNITTNHTLEAKWDSIPLYDVTFADPDGRLVAAVLPVGLSVPQARHGFYQGEKVSTPTVINIGNVVKINATEYYKFKGWYNGTNLYDFNQGINATITLNATWEVFNGATVTFNIGPKFPSYTNPAPQVVYPDVHITEPTEIRQGNTDIIYESDNHNHKYEFQYWYVEGGDPNTPFDFAIDPTSDVILVPKYTDTQVNVIKFNTGGIISTPSDQNVPSGGTIAQPRDPSNPSSSAPYPAPGSEHPHGGHVYKFDYWYSTDSNVPYDYNIPVTDDVEIKIRWTDVTPWTVTFVTNHGNAPTAQTVLNGNKASTPSNPIKDYVHVDIDSTTGERTAAYRFVKWFEQGDTTETAFDFENTNITTNHTLEAKWDSIPLYDVTFADPDGRLVAAVLPVGLSVPQARHGLYQGEKVATPTVIKINDVVKIGAGQYYKFKGWYNGTTLYDFNAGITATITLNATWEVFTGAVVTFDLDGHFPIYGPIAPQTVFPDHPIQKPTELPDDTEEEIVGPDGFVHRYTFKYWYIDGEDPNVPFVFPGRPTNNITLKPKLIDEIVVEIQYDTDGIGMTPATVKVVRNESFTPPTNPTTNQEFTHTDGHKYKFVKWYDSTDTTKAEFDFTNGSSTDVILKADWLDVTPWTVTFDIGKNYTNQNKTIINGNVVSPIDTPINGTIYEPKDASGNRTEASKFSHWYLSTDTTEAPFDFSTPIVSSIILKGKWTDMGLYSFSFSDPTNVFINEDVPLNQKRRLPSQIIGKIEGEKILEPTMIKIGDLVKVIDKSTEQEKTKFYKFKGWSDGTTPFTPYDFTKSLPSSSNNSIITLSATWEEMTTPIHEITYLSQYVKPSKNKEYVENGNKVIMPTEPVVDQVVTVNRIKYKFSFWYATNSNVKFDFNMPIRESYTITAKWVSVQNENNNKPSRDNTSNNDQPRGGGGGSTGYIPSIKTENVVINPLTPQIPQNPKIPIEQEKRETEQIKNQIDEFIKNGDINIITNTDVNKDEVVLLRQLLNKGSDDNYANIDVLAGENTNRNWHKIAKRVWYYANETVGLVRGWHIDEQDTQRYYLDLNTGLMACGWTKIDGYYYYFSEEPASDNWYYNGFAWTTKNRNDKSIGSMYRNEWTPDGYFVDENGHYVESMGQINQNQIANIALTNEEFLASQTLTYQQEKALQNILSVDEMSQIQNIRSVQNK